MKALVSGGAGFLGRYLVKGLLREGHSVSIIDLPGSETDDLARDGVEVIKKVIPNNNIFLNTNLIG